MTIDPQAADLAARLAETGIRNTASAISSKIETLKAKRDDKATINQLVEIIYDLINDRNELLGIAKSYEQEFVAQKISERDIEYITTKFIPVIKDVLKQVPSDGTTNMEKTIDGLTPLLSVEIITVLQLIGFNFKQALGEPLTLLLQQFITSKAPIDPQSELERTKLAIAYNTEALKMVQNKEACDRFEQLKVKGIL